MWKKFEVKDILTIEQTKSVVSKDKLRSGDIPYVSRTKLNNGYVCKCGNVEKINKGNCITIGAETGLAFYQPNDFVAGNKIYRLSKEGLNENHYLFLASILNKQACNYNYSDARIPQKISKEIILLPTNELGEIDWDYMENCVENAKQSYIDDLEKEYERELKNYLSVAQLKDYELTEDDKKILANTTNFKNYNITDLFDIKNSKNILKSQVDFSKKEHPYVTAQERNNSIMAEVSYDENYLDKGNCIFIGGKTMVISYQKEDFFSNDSHNLLLYPKKGNLSEKAFMYLATVLYKSLKPKYEWNSSISSKKIKKDTISLPTTCDGNIDYAFMEKYIEAIQKLAIKDKMNQNSEMLAKAKEIISY